jgi:hypothetical protein
LAGGVISQNLSENALKMPKKQKMHPNERGASVTQGCFGALLLSALVPAFFELG